MRWLKGLSQKKMRYRNMTVDGKAIEMGVKFAAASLYANGETYSQDRGLGSEM